MTQPDGTTLSMSSGRLGAASDRLTTYVRLVYSAGLGHDAPPHGQVWTFGPGKERSIRLGRKPTHPEGGTTIPLPFDGWSSRDHVQLTHLGMAEGGVIVEDLGSRNGTFVDARPVQGRTIARTGQAIRCGGSIFVVGRAPLERAGQILARTPPPPDFDVRSWPALALWERLAALGNVDHGVLLLGEMGTGKTRLARAIHLLGPRRDRPFAAFNASAIPHQLEEATLFGVVGGFIPGVKEKQGWLTTAGDGTLFLDEIGDLPPLAQAKLLDAFDPTDPSHVAVGGTRRIPTRCRLVTATNRDVFELALAGTLRQDLLSRLVTSQVTVPPLRERREDLMWIFAAALAHHGCPPPAGSPAVAEVEVAEALLTAAWVENVRGLQSLAARICAGERLTVELVHAHAHRGAAPAPAPPGRSPPPQPRPAEPAAPACWPPTPRELVLLLAANGFEVKQAAEAIGRTRETLSRLVTKTFGSRDAARMAHAVLSASGRLPMGDRIRPLFDLYCEQDATPRVLAAREQWRLHGLSPETSAEE